MQEYGRHRQNQTLKDYVLNNDRDVGAYNETTGNFEPVEPESKRKTNKIYYIAGGLFTLTTVSNTVLSVLLMPTIPVLGAVVVSGTIGLALGGIVIVLDKIVDFFE